MTRLSTPLITTQGITWYTDGTATAEASTIHFRVGRVYDDACDLGCTLLSHRTGTRVPCVVQAEAYDDEGDLLYWILRPLEGNQFSLTVYND